MNIQKGLKTLGIDVDITIKEKKAQILIAGAIFILAMGVAWSFINGWSSIIVKTDIKKHTERVDKKVETAEPKSEIKK